MTYKQNRNARIGSRVSKKSKMRTETKYRDDALDMAITTDKNTHATALFIDFDGGTWNGGETVRFDGHQARTLFRLLSNHYEYTGKSFDPIT